MAKKKILDFECVGPLKIPFRSAKAAKVIESDHIKEFFTSHDHIVSRCGCYVFAIRSGGGMMPYYVGEATRTFEQEIFTPHKLSNYQRALAEYRKGKPVMFLVVAPKAVGPVNAKAIKEVQDFLIQAGVAKNPALLNIRDRKAAQFSIRGVLRTGQGQPSKAASKFKACMRLKK